ncbi:hypothetical protein [Nostoc sp.]
MQNRPSPTSKGTDLKLVQARERFVELTSYYPSSVTLREGDR